MRQKINNQTMKKTFILYKGHTGWRIKTRVLGGVVVGLAALTFAENGSVVGHAATQTAVENTQVQAAPVKTPAPTTSPETEVKSEETPTVSANTTEKTATSKTLSVAQNMGRQAVSASNLRATQSSAESAAPSSQTQPVTSEKTATPEADQTAPTTTSSDYPVLSQDKDVSIGVDQTQVSLTANQIADHFTAKVENRDNSDQDDNPTKNTVTQQIGKDGTIALTSNDAHEYYGTYGETSLHGHQAAHVSFEHEIDFGHNFSMTGALGIGSKTSGGADSVGFIFAPGDPSKATQGGSGGQLGLGGLSNAFGFVFDEYNNVSQYHDPSSQPYVGWRTTDANGNLQAAARSDWKAASQVGLNDRQVNPLNEFTMNYNAETQVLTVVLGNNVTFSRAIKDVTTGYSISVAASTGGSWNDYSARIDKFTYTPKTIPLNVQLVDSADQGALLDHVNVTAIANIGDTVSVFSTQDAAQRAVEAGEVDPSLVSILPTDTAGNVYVIDGAQVVKGQTGTAHTVGGAADQDVADGTYYTYTVTDASQQQVTIPVRLAYKAEVTPIDATTQAPIAGLDPITVTTVAGEPALVHFPGYTPTKVVLAAPKAGETVAHDNLEIDQATTATTTETTDTQAQAIGHYYTSQGETVDGKPVVGHVLVGTNQNISQVLNHAALTDEQGKPVVSGSATAGIQAEDYYWSSVGVAKATDSTAEDTPQAAGSLLVPTSKTLVYWLTQADNNETQANEYLSDAQQIYDAFKKIVGLTDAQQADAQKEFEAITTTYQNVSESNQVAQDYFNAAQDASLDVQTIVTDGQQGYAALEKAQNLLGQFKEDLQQLTTTHEKAQNLLATIGTTAVDYQAELPIPRISLGSGFGGVQADQLKPTYFAYYQGDNLVTPRDAGTYTIKMTDLGRQYLKGLAANNPNAGLFVPGILTINPLEVWATINIPDKLDMLTMTYGDRPQLSGTYGDVTDTDLEDFEAVDQVSQKVLSWSDLQAGGKYLVRYTAQAQAKAKVKLAQAGNYKIKGFKSSTLTVNPRPITVDINKPGKMYGGADPALDSNSTITGQLVNGDKLEDLHINLTREKGEDVTADGYKITGTSDNQNYAVTINPGTLVISKRPVTVTAANQEKVYGDADPTLILTPESAEQLVNHDTLAALDVSLSRAKGEDVKQDGYTITGNSNSQNYVVTINSGTLTITKRPVTVTAANQEKVYGDADPTLILTPDSTKQLVNHDTLAALDVSLSRAKGEDVKQGGYAITGNSNSQNYAVTINRGTLTITKRPVTVTAADQEKVYGDADPTLTLTPDSTKQLVNHDTLAALDVSLNRAKGEDVKQGGYAITGNSNSQNYAVTINPGTLTITQRPVEVTAADQEKVYGNADPMLTLTPESTKQLVNHDTLAALDVNLSRAKGEDVKQGGYAITGNNDSQNYAVTVVPGHFYVTPKPVVARLQTIKTIYGNPVALNGTSGLPETLSKLSATDLEVVTGTGEIVAPDRLNAGTYTIRLTAAAKKRLQAQADYQFKTWPTGHLTVLPRDITVKIVNQQKFAGHVDPRIQVQVTNGTLVGTTNPAALQLSFILPAHEAVGVYPIQALAGTSNYTVHVESGQLKVLGRTVDANGDVTITEKDAAGEVVHLSQQWSDQTTTVYTYDPAMHKAQVSEWRGGKEIGTQAVNLQGETIVKDDTGALTVLAIENLAQPFIQHYPAATLPTQPASPDQLAVTTPGDANPATPITPTQPGISTVHTTTRTGAKTPSAMVKPEVLSETKRAEAPSQLAMGKPRAISHPRFERRLVTKSENRHVTLTIKKLAVMQSLAASQTGEKRLPQTSETRSNWMTIVGMLLLMVSGWPIRWLKRH